MWRFLATPMQFCLENSSHTTFTSPLGAVPPPSSLPTPQVSHTPLLTDRAVAALQPQARGCQPQRPDGDAGGGATRRPAEKGVRSARAAATVDDDDDEEAQLSNSDGPSPNDCDTSSSEPTTTPSPNRTPPSTVSYLLPITAASGCHQMTTQALQPCPYLSHFLVPSISTRPHRPQRSLGSLRAGGHSLPRCNRAHWSCEGRLV